MKSNEITAVLPFIVVIFFATNVFAQQHTLSGKVINKSKLPLEFVTASLMKNDSLLVNQISTDSLGFFSFKAVSGKYTLLLQQYGVESLKKEIHLIENIDLGEIEIDESTMLDGIEIISRKKLFERKVDRLVFNVENSVSASGGDLIDALKITPGLQVNDNEISIVGKSSVSVMIDDRIVQLSGESLINFLRTISADEIKNIEVITTPPAKYEAEGNSGLINIQYKKGRKNSWNNSIRSSYIQTSYPAFSLGNTFRYNKNKFALDVSLDTRGGSENALTKEEIHYPNQLWIGNDDSKNIREYYSGKLNADYQITDKSNIGAIVSLHHSGTIIKSDIYYDIFKGNEFLKKIQTNGDVFIGNKNTSVNLNYRNTLDTIGKKLSIDLDYFNYRDEKSNNFNTMQTDNTKQLLQNFVAENNGDIGIQNYSAKIDVEYPIKWAKINYGAKTSFTKTNSDVQFYDKTSGERILDSDQTDEFEYKENIHALYIDVAKSIGSKWQLKLGLRYEMTQTIGSSKKVEKDNKFVYHKLFPTAYVLYQVNDDNFLNFNYSRRIKRPAFWELNPFRWYTSSYSYNEGNPFLQPLFNNNFELTYGYNQKWFSTLFTQIQTDGFGQLPFVDEVNYTQIFIRKNYYTQYSFGLSQSYTLNSISWLESNFQANGFYIKTNINPDFKDILPPQNGYGMNLLANNSIFFNKQKTIIGEINFSYNSPAKGTIYQVTGSGSLDLGVKFLFLNKDLQLSLNIYDVFKTSNPDYTTFTNGIRQVYNTYNDNRYVRLSLRYNFGNKNISVSEKQFGNEDERSRL